RGEWSESGVDGEAVAQLQGDRLAHLRRSVHVDPGRRDANGQGSEWIEDVGDRIRESWEHTIRSDGEVEITQPVHVILSNGKQGAGAVVEIADLVDGEREVGELDALEVADPIGAVEGAADAALIAARRNGAWGLGDGDEAKRVGSGNRIVGPVGREDRDVEVAIIGGVANLAQDIAARANLTIGVVQQFDVQLGIAIQDVVAGATADAVTAGAAQQNIAAEVAGRLD